MREGSLFSGYNGLGMAVSEVFGSEPAWFGEIEPGPSRILEHHWPDVPNLGDITKVDWDAVEPVDILSGGFPCQDVSAAGKRAGLHPDTRSGLWNHMAYAISKLRPRYVVAENVRGLLSAEAHSDVEPCPWCLGDGPGEPALRALGAVLGDLAELGYDAEWCGLRAAAVGAPHGRFRIFILARDTASVGGRPPRSDNGESLRSDRARGAGELATSDTAVIGHERSRPARHGRSGPADGGLVATDTDHAGRQQHSRTVATRPELAAAERGTALAGLLGATAANTQGNGRHEGRTEPAWELGGPDAAERGDEAASYPERGGRDGRSPHPIRQQVGRATPAGSGTPTAWGQYGPAIERWERVLGRSAPAPTEPGSKGAQRLSPRFVEWMMGLPPGHVTDVPGLTRNAQLKALGNGVVPAQAVAALRYLLGAA